MRRLVAFLLALFIPACTPSFHEGDYLYREGRYSEAVALLSRYVEGHPEDAVGHFTLGDALYLKYSDDYDKNRADVADLNRSFAEFSRAIELNRGYGAAYSQRGVVLSVLGRKEQAKREMDRAIEIDPECDRSYYNRAYWHEEHGNYRQAISDYERYLGLSENRKWRADAQRRIESLRLKLGRASAATSSRSKTAPGRLR